MENPKVVLITILLVLFAAVGLIKGTFWFLSQKEDTSQPQPTDACKGIDSFLSLDFESSDADEQVVGDGSFNGHIRPVGQHVYPAYLTAFKAALLCEEAYDVASADFVLLSFTYI